MIDRLEGPVGVDTVELAIRPVPHAFASDRRAAVEADFARAQAANPALWNGAFFLFDRVAVDPDAGRFAAEGALTDFATFLHWRAGVPLDTSLAHVFPVGAVVSADDRLLVGRMGAHTANPGRLYPPSGSFDPHDLSDGQLDPIANAVREIREEVGLEVADWPSDPGFLVIPSGPNRVAVVKVYRAAETAAALQTQIEAFLPDGSDGELAGVTFVPLAERLDPKLSAVYVNALLGELDRKR